MNRVSDNAGDEHVVHVFCLSHRCRITADTNVPLSANFAAAAAPPVSVDCAADSEDSCNNNNH